MTMLLGASGAGKSVLLKLILGLLRPDGGTISVNGERIDTMPEDAAARPAQRHRHGVPGERAVRLADRGKRTSASACRTRRASRTRTSTRAWPRCLGFVGLTGYEERMPSELSGGQRRRVGIARAMASKPGLLLFDDPDHRPRSGDCQQRGRRDREAARPRARHLDLRHPPDSRRLLRGAARGASPTAAASRSATRPPSARASWCCTRDASSSRAPAPSCSPRTTPTSRSSSS